MYIDMPEKPKKQYKSFQDYYARHLHKSKLGIRCLGCFSSGRVPAPGEFNDPVEGYKMARFVNCSECSGRGYVSDKIAKSYYKEIVDNFTERYDKYRFEMSIIKDILKKLNKQEKEYLLKGKLPKGLLI